MAETLLAIVLVASSASGSRWPPRPKLRHALPDLARAPATTPTIMTTHGGQLISTRDAHSTPHHMRSMSGNTSGSGLTRREARDRPTYSRARI